mgnify:CR=1 FL=1
MYDIRLIATIMTALVSTFATCSAVAGKGCCAFVAHIADALTRFAVDALDAGGCFQDGISDCGDRVGHCLDD